MDKMLRVHVMKWPMIVSFSFSFYVYSDVMFYCKLDIGISTTKFDGGALKGTLNNYLDL